MSKQRKGSRRPPRLQDEMALDKKLQRVSDDRSRTTKKYRRLLRENEALRREMAALLSLRRGRVSRTIKKHQARRSSETTAVVVASDWHIEEQVRPETVDGLNEYTLDIARRRAGDFFAHALHLVEIERKHTAVPHLVLALLGDFISGNIHEDVMESCTLPPVDAMFEAQTLIDSGIRFLLENSNLKLTIPCCVGNHPRITHRERIANRTGNSLEYFMYRNLAQRWASEPRVQFVVPQGYFAFVDVYGVCIRFHHGHGIRYQGGVGGLTIPLNKAIAQWNKAKWADLDVLGHWHTFFDNGNAIVNGSTIGYSPFAIEIKASYERPKQAFFTINSKWREKVCVRPILFS